MKLNRNAMIVWWYIWETVRNCPDETRQDAAFCRLISDMLKHYPNEYAALDALIDVTEMLKEQV